MANTRVSALTLAGVGLLLMGVACLAWVAWEFFGTSVVAERHASDQIKHLQEQWESSPSAPSDEEPTSVAVPELGEASWLIRIPALGESYQWPIVAGVEVEDLQRGVGWYNTTALPGQVGNFALAGHRVTHGEPFRHLLELSEGDKIVIETREAIYTYEITVPARELTVQDTETWVLDPVPGESKVEPSEALITLTTCEDFLRSPDRSVAFGTLVDVEKK